MYLLVRVLLAGLFGVLSNLSVWAEPVAGPYNVGPVNDELSGLRATIDDKALIKGSSAWSMNCWVRSNGPAPSKTAIAGFGDRSNMRGTQRYLASFPDGLRFWGAEIDIPFHALLKPDTWEMLTAVYDGINLQLYLNGREVASQAVVLSNAKPEIHLAPLGPWEGHFHGKIALFTLWNQALAPANIERLSRNANQLQQAAFTEALPEQWDSKGLTSHPGDPHQKPETFPQAKSLAEKPGPPRVSPSETLMPDPDGGLILAGPWKLIEASKAGADGASLSMPNRSVVGWYPATVPGTVLTALVDQGVYPDPYVGLNNLAIPESLAHQDYWYRLEFTAPANFTGRHATLTFNGINYAAEVWFNGVHLGTIRGAFIRGIFNVTALTKPGQVNALAIRISPPPHPGIAHEQSVLAGAGPNGGAMCWDGPTFFCTEGWDWIPGIRDRDTGLWQNVVLKATGPVSLGDPHIVTRIPQPIGSRADVSIEVQLRNASETVQTGTFRAAFEGVSVEKKVSIPAGAVQTVRLAPDDFPQLAVSRPRLWWPNGYGKPELYHLVLSFRGADGQMSDSKRLRFGMREISVVLSALNPERQVGRYEFFPAAAAAEEVVKHDHASLVKTLQGWVPTLAGEPDKLPGIKASNDIDTERFLEIRVNGTPVALRGGNWGIDDAMKRVSRERLEPYIRLQRDANFNVLRNWCGQSTEETLYDLCDEYGIMVWDEFWISTQWANVEPTDPALFLANAKDVLTRFRNHPSIVLWCGRNEGVPPPSINAPLDGLIREVDGTRYYQPASITINLEGSGPWKYIPPEAYFTKKGITTELGLPSPPSADAIQAMIPVEDLWPPNDTWAYHDWIPKKGAMDVTTFMAALTEQFGSPSDLMDFSKKAQMINYVSYRALYEGMNASLWKPTTGRFLWMSHPAWPSTVWQIYSSDYEAAGAFYGVRKGCEPIHIQMNANDRALVVTNTTLQPLGRIKATVEVFDSSGNRTSSRAAILDVGTDSSATGFMDSVPRPTNLQFVKLQLQDTEGGLLSENFYWDAPDAAGYQAMNQLPEADLAVSATGQKGSEKTTVAIGVVNPSTTVAVMITLSLRDAGGRRVLPTYTTDNYFSLLPGEKRQISLEEPRVADGPLQVLVNGWNVKAASIPVK